MKILIDTDVLLDVGLNREEFVQDSSEILRWALRGGDAAVAWQSLTNVSYLLKKGGRDFLQKLLQIVDVVPAGLPEARRALQLPMKDLEDAFQVAAALHWGAECIVTRNLNDYRNSPVPARSPVQFLKRL